MPTFLVEALGVSIISFVVERVLRKLFYNNNNNVNNINIDYQPSTTQDEIDELLIAMENQIDNQNTEIKELKKQIENLKSLLISQLPEYINAALKYI